MDHKEWKAAREKAKTQQADLEAQMAYTDRAPILGDLVSAKDVRAKWNAIGLDRQRAVINLLCTVTLLRRGPGQYETGDRGDRLEMIFTRKDLERGYPEKS